MGALPPFLAPSSHGHLRTHSPLLPSVLARALPIDGRGRRDETGATTGSLSRSPEPPLPLRPPPPPPSPLSFSIFRFLPVRGPLDPPLDPPLVRSVGLGEPFRPHVWPPPHPRPSGRQDQTVLKWIEPARISPTSGSILRGAQPHRTGDRPPLPQMPPPSRSPRAR